MKITEVDRLWRKAEQSVKASVATGPTSHTMGTGKKTSQPKKGRQIIERKGEKKKNQLDSLSRWHTQDITKLI